MSTDAEEAQLSTSHSTHDILFIEDWTRLIAKSTKVIANRSMFKTFGEVSEVVQANT